MCQEEKALKTVFQLGFPKGHMVGKRHIGMYQLPQKLNLGLKHSLRNVTLFRASKFP